MSRRRIAVTLAAVAALAPVATVAAIAATLPSVAPLAHDNPRITSFMRERAAATHTAPAPLADWVALDAISTPLTCAVVKSEDRWFFRHHGFVWSQLGRAAAAGGRMGGSTLTQQLARNLYLSPARSWSRKLQEALLTRALEARLDKRRLLELYLNVVEWGDGVWGVAAATRHYFGKPPSQIGWAEAAFLAAQLAAPRRARTGDNLARALRVERRVLGQLYASGLVDAAGLARAAAEARVIVPAWPRLDERPLPAARALADGCGLGRELAEEARSAAR